MWHVAHIAVLATANLSALRRLENLLRGDTVEDPEDFEIDSAARQPVVAGNVGNLT